MPDRNTLDPDQRRALEATADTLAAEFDGVVDRQTIEQFLTTSHERFTERPPAGDAVQLTERHARQRLQALAKVQGERGDGVPVVLFLCVHNAGRSQMALGWFNHLAAGRAVAWSGGSEPGDQINPVAVAAMAEVGIDIAREYPKPWTEEIVRAADVVVTMGCGDTCPYYPGTRYQDWELDDPHGQGIDAVRPIRDEIERRVRKLLGELGVSTAA